jgi:hypothetical protein
MIQTTSLVGFRHLLGLGVIQLMGKATRKTSIFSLTHPPTPSEWMMYERPSLQGTDMKDSGEGEMLLPSMVVQSVHCTRLLSRGDKWGWRSCLCCMQATHKVSPDTVGLFRTGMDSCWKPCMNEIVFKSPGLGWLCSLWLWTKAQVFVLVRPEMYIIRDL